MISPVFQQVNAKSHRTRVLPIDRGYQVSIAEVHFTFKTVKAATNSWRGLREDFGSMLWTMAHYQGEQRERYCRDFEMQFKDCVRRRKLAHTLEKARLLKAIEDESHMSMFIAKGHVPGTGEEDAFALIDETLFSQGVERVSDLTPQVKSKWKREEQRRSSLAQLLEPMSDERVAYDYKSSNRVSLPSPYGIKTPCNFSQGCNTLFRLIDRMLLHLVDGISLKPHSIVRNIPRRAHALGLLLYFPCAPRAICVDDSTFAFELPDARHRDPISVKKHLDLYLPDHQRVLGRVKLHRHTADSMVSPSSPSNIPSDSSAQVPAFTGPDVTESLSVQPTMDSPPALILPQNSQVLDAAKFSGRTLEIPPDDDEVVRSRSSRATASATTSLSESSDQRRATRGRQVSSAPSWSDRRSDLSPLSSYASSVSSNENLAETKFHALKYSATSTWEPRMLLVAGSVQETLDNSSRVTDTVFDTPMYSLVYDRNVDNDILNFWSSVKTEQNKTREESEETHAKDLDHLDIRLKVVNSSNSSPPENVVTTTPDLLEDEYRKDKADVCVDMMTPNNYVFRLNSKLFENATDPSVFDPLQLDSSLLWKWGKGHGEGGSDITQMGPAGRFGATEVVYRGQLYVFGGAAETDWRTPVLMNDLWTLSISSNDPGEYIWNEIEVQSRKPPPCAFHLSVVYEGFMYTYISKCVVAERSLDEMGSKWFKNTLVEVLGRKDLEAMLEAELRRADLLKLKRGTAEAYRNRLNRSSATINELWRIDLESEFPQWEKLELTISKTATAIIKGGIAMTAYVDRLFVYGVSSDNPQISIGVLDIALRMWVAWVRIPNAPVWVTAVAIGKLWFLLGREVWGIFNLETFEWRYARKPLFADIRYGCSAVWLPPYVPFAPSLDITALNVALHMTSTGDIKYMYSTDLACQFYWLQRQGRRVLDDMHTIIFFGGFDASGKLCNQIDQLIIMLPPDLAVNCFTSPSTDVDLLHASLFGMKLKDEKLYGSEVVLYRKGEVELLKREAAWKRECGEAQTARLVEEVKRLQEVILRRERKENEKVAQLGYHLRKAEQSLLKDLQEQKDELCRLRATLAYQMRLNVKCESKWRAMMESSTRDPKHNDDSNQRYN